MFSLLCILLSPVLLLISLPLAIFAALTTSLAFSALFLRALVVYAELAAVLIQNQFAINNRAAKRVSADWRFSPPVTTDEKDSRRKSRRSSACSGNSNGGSMTPRILESSGLGIYGCRGIERDFEGVGGWRIPGSDDDDVLWTSMNSRLELPAMGDERLQHHRSLTSNSLSSASMISGSRARSFARTPPITRAAGNTSPEEYFANRAASKSTTALDTVNIGTSLLRRKTSSTSTFSSESSARTLPASTSRS